MPLIKRATKGSPLNHAEMDGNLTFVDEKIDSVAAGLQEQISANAASIDTKIEAASLTLQEQIDLKQADLGFADADGLAEYTRSVVTFNPLTELGSSNTINNFSMGNTKTLTSNATFQLTDPFLDFNDRGQQWGLGLTNGTDDVLTVTLPENTYSVAQQAVMQAFPLPARARLDLHFRWDGQYARMTGEPLVASAQGSSLPTETAFATALPLTGNLAMVRHFVTGPLNLTLAPNPVRGAQLSLELVADGSNAPTFGTGLFKLEGSQDYSNVADVVNVVSLWSDGTRAFYAISYSPSVTETAPVLPAAPVNTVAPTVPTTASLGSTVIGTAGTWTGSPEPTFDYRWQRDDAGSWIDSQFVTLSAALTPIGTWRLKVTATNSEGVAEALSGSLTLSEAAAGGTATPISISSSQNITNEGNEVYAATAAGTSNTAHIFATKSLAADGWAEAQRPNDTDSSCYVCLDAANAPSLGYSSTDYLAQCNAVGLVQYATNATTPTSTGYTLPPGAGSRIRVRRAGDTVVLETTVDDGAVWTLRHTYTAKTTGVLYPHFYTTFSTFARKVYQPRLMGFE